MGGPIFVGGGSAPLVLLACLPTHPPPANGLASLVGVTFLMCPQRLFFSPCLSVRIIGYGGTSYKGYNGTLKSAELKITF